MQGYHDPPPLFLQCMNLSANSYLLEYSLGLPGRGFAELVRVPEVARLFPPNLFLDFSTNDENGLCDLADFAPAATISVVSLADSLLFPDLDFLQEPLVEHYLTESCTYFPGPFVDFFGQKSSHHRVKGIASSLLSVLMVVCGYGFGRPVCEHPQPMSPMTPPGVRQSFYILI